MRRIVLLTLLAVAAGPATGQEALVVLHEMDHRLGPGEALEAARHHGLATVEERTPSLRVVWVLGSARTTSADDAPRVNGTPQVRVDAPARLGPRQMVELLGVVLIRRTRLRLVLHGRMGRIE